MKIGRVELLHPQTPSWWSLTINFEYFCAETDSQTQAQVPTPLATPTIISATPLDKVLSTQALKAPLGARESDSIPPPTTRDRSRGCRMPRGAGSGVLGERANSTEGFQEKEVLQQEKGVLGEVKVPALVDLSQEGVKRAEVVELGRIIGLVKVKNGLKEVNQKKSENGSGDHGKYGRRSGAFVLCKREQTSWR